MRHASPAVSLTWQPPHGRARRVRVARRDRLSRSRRGAGAAPRDAL